MLQNYKKIMVAVDGSAEAEQAFQKAITVAIRNNAELLLAHVIDTRALQTVNSFDSILIEQTAKMAQDTLKSYMNQAKQKGCSKISTIIDYGSPKSILAEKIPKEHKVNLIIIGATGLNTIERLFIGSVSEFVVREAPCDVLVVRTNNESTSSTEIT